MKIYWILEWKDTFKVGATCMTQSHICSNGCRGQRFNGKLFLMCKNRNKRKKCQTRNWHQGNRRSQSALLYILYIEKAASKKESCHHGFSRLFKRCRNVNMLPSANSRAVRWKLSTLLTRGPVHRWRKKNKQTKQIHIGFLIEEAVASSIITMATGDRPIQRKIGGM